jgi:hypothetical protein
MKVRNMCVARAYARAQRQEVGVVAAYTEALGYG